MATLQASVLTSFETTSRSQSLVLLGWEEGCTTGSRNEQCTLTRPDLGTLWEPPSAPSPEVSNLCSATAGERNGIEVANVDLRGWDD